MPGKPDPLKASLNKKNLEHKKQFLKGHYLIIPEVVITDPDLTVYEKLVFGGLLHYIRPRGKGRCNPKIESLAALCGISVRSVKRALEGLYEKCWVYWVRTRSSSWYGVYSKEGHDQAIERIARDREARAKESKEAKEAKETQPDS